MGYQALLFCPDEKTARTVTQVLSELDFAVVPCTEPFAAVKKLMGEHFDAVVVDCDNEQNATLLFKSARNAPNNQSALAVAVVEGQVGVAKAFRIGANLVLTKPINVEQAKGTLRVARGLLRKGEAAKPASATTVAAGSPKPATSAPPSPKPPVRVAASWPSSPAPSAAVASSPVQNPAARPGIAASVSAAAGSGAKLIDANRSAAANDSSASASASASSIISVASSPAAAQPEREKTKTETKTNRTSSSPPEIVTPPPSGGFAAKSSSGIGSGSASAPAPARDSKAVVSTEDKPSAVIAEPESRVEEVPVPQSSVPAPTLTFGGTVGSDAEPTEKGGSRKTFLAVAIVALIVVGAYVAWTQVGGGKMPWSFGVAPQAPTATAAIPRVTPNAAPVARPAAPVRVPATPAAESTIPAPVTASQPAEAAPRPSDVQTVATASASAEEARPRTNKISPSADSPKPSASAAIASKAPASTATAPTVIKHSEASQSAFGKPAATPATDLPAPSLTGIAANNGAALPSLVDSGAAPAPVLQTTSVSQGISQGLVIKRVQPSYPSNALHMQIEGPVELLATISKSGNISAVKILKGDPQLARAAVDAVKQWKYKPYLLNGEPVEIQTQVTVNFKLPR